MLRPDRGRIEIEGKVLFDSAAGIDIPAEKRRIGYVFQEGRLFPHLTVRRNLLYGYALVPAGDRYIELDRIVALLGLNDLLERRPGDLSGGEKQRVAIGRALLSSPRMLLLDEPLASLDAHRREEILRYLELLRDEVQIPIVYVSHAVEEVVRLADTVVLMAAGKVVAVGDVEDVMGRPDLRPAGGVFEGGAVIDARVSAQDMQYDLATLAFDGGTLTVTNLDALIGEPVRVRVRARDVSIALARPERNQHPERAAGDDHRYHARAQRRRGRVDRGREHTAALARDAARGRAAPSGAGPRGLCADQGGVAGSAQA